MRRHVLGTVLLWAFIVCGLLVAPAGTRAQVLESGKAPWDLQIHAFVSQGFIYTTDNNYLARSQRGSVEFTELGLNVSKAVTDKLRIGAQLFARDLGPQGGYRPQFDWFHLDYRFFDWLGVRAGRVRIPFGLYNEYRDIDSGRVPVLLPQSMYPEENREILLAVTGGELYGNISLGRAGQFEYRAYGGTMFAEPPGRINPNASIVGVRSPYLFGGRLMWLTPLEGLQLGASGQALRLENDVELTPAATEIFKMLNILPPNSNGSIDDEFSVRLWVVSMEYAFRDLLISAEYGRWLAERKFTPAILPRLHPVNERYYLMASYRFVPWFTAGVYYAGHYGDVDDRKGRDAYRHDFAGSLRFDVMANWLVKAEAHLMRGTADLDPGLNGVENASELNDKWGLFLLKTTAYF
jgi:hypothetical protein